MKKALILASILLISQAIPPAANAQMNLLETKRQAAERRQAEKYYWKKNNPYAINGAPQDLSGNYPSLPPQRYSQPASVYGPSGGYGYTDNRKLYGY
jgi:hypothetical protein